MTSTTIEQAREVHAKIEQLSGELAALKTERETLLSTVAASLGEGGCPEWCNVSASPSDFARQWHGWHVSGAVLQREHWGLRLGQVRDAFEFIELDGSRRLGPVNRSRTAPPGYMIPTNSSAMQPA